MKRAAEFLSDLECLWLGNKAVFYLPNIILAEVKKYYSENLIKKKNDTDEYRKQIKDLVKIVEYKPSNEAGNNYNMFFNVEMNRHHIINFCRICEVEQLTPKKKVSKKQGGRWIKVEQKLSFVDMMLLSMASELKYVHKEKIFLLTNDARVKTIANDNSEEFPIALNIAEDSKPHFMLEILSELKD